jgi:hypothetical protein
MAFILIILSNLIWALYSLSEGLKDGTYEYYRDNSKVVADFNYKKMSYIQRMIVLVSTSLLLIIGIGWLSILFIFSKLILFKYFYFVSYECSLRKIQHKDKKYISLLLDNKKNRIKFLNEK